MGLKIENLGIESNKIAAFTTDDVVRKLIQAIPLRTAKLTRLRRGSAVVEKYSSTAIREPGMAVASTRPSPVERSSASKRPEACMWPSPKSTKS